MDDNDVNLHVKTDHQHGLSVLRISGELDAPVAAAFTAQARAAVQATAGLLVVDLSGLTYLDACGARALTCVLRSLADGRLAGLTQCPHRIHRVLSLAGLPPLAYWLGDGVGPPPAWRADRRAARR